MSDRKLNLLLMRKCESFLMRLINARMIFQKNLKFNNQLNYLSCLMLKQITHRLS